jgi:hypothetical protein
VGETTQKKKKKKKKKKEKIITIKIVKEVPRGESFRMEGECSCLPGGRSRLK